MKFPLEIKIQYKNNSQDTEITQAEFTAYGYSQLYGDILTPSRIENAYKIIIQTRSTNKERRIRNVGST